MVRRPLLLASFGLLAALILHSLRADARGAQDPLTGRVALGKADLPGKKGDAAYLKALAKAARGRVAFWEDEKAGKWTIHYAAVAPRPLRDVEIRIFDISKGKQLVATRDKMLFAESRIVSGTIALDRDEIFHPNARMLIVFVSGDRTVAQREFYIQGKVERLSGRADFGDDAAAAAAGDAGDQQTLDDQLAGERRRRR